MKSFCVLEPCFMPCSLISICFCVASHKTLTAGYTNYDMSYPTSPLWTVENLFCLITRALFSIAEEQYTAGCSRYCSKIRSVQYSGFAGSSEKKSGYESRVQRISGCIKNIHIENTHCIALQYSPFIFANLFCNGCQ